MIKNKIRKNTTLVLFVVSVLLVSCKSNQGSVMPDMDLQSLYRTQGLTVGTPGDTTTIADLSWQEFFTDAKLQNLIGEALQNNISLKVALTRIQQAEATLMMAKGAYLPTVTAALQGNATRISAGADGTKVLGYNTASSPTVQLGVMASWEINLWGKLSSQKRARVASLLSTQEYRNLIQTSVVAGVARSYYSLLALDEQLRVTRRTIELLTESTQTIEALMEAGQSTAVAVEQSRALLYSTRLSVPVLESAIRQQENAICTLLGRVPGTVDRSSLDVQTDPSRLSYGVAAHLMSRRPDVKQAEFAFRSAFEMTNAAQASLYPSFTISTASLGFVAGTLSDFFNPAHLAGTVAAGLAQPILFKKQLKGNLLIAKAQQEEAMLNFKNAMLTAGQEVSDVLFGYQTALGKNEMRTMQVESLTNAEEYSRELLLAGEANYLEVISAQQSLLSSQLSQVNDRLEQLNYSVSLYKALGGGWR